MRMIITVCIGQKINYFIYFILLFTRSTDQAVTTRKEKTVTKSTRQTVTRNMVRLWSVLHCMLMAKAGRNCFLSHHIFGAVAKILRRQNNICHIKYLYTISSSTNTKLPFFVGIFAIFLTIMNVAYIFSVGILSKQEHLCL